MRRWTYEDGWLVGGLQSLVWVGLVAWWFPETHWGVYALTSGLCFSLGAFAEYIERQQAHQGCQDGLSPRGAPDEQE